MTDQKNRLGQPRADSKFISHKDDTDICALAQAKIIALPNREPGYIGDCPVCRRNNGIVNIRRAHFGVCHEHNLFWQIGPDGIFHGHLLQDEVDWQLARELLSSYHKITPEWSRPCP